jgi:hypothetical protein
MSHHKRNVKVVIAGVFVLACAAPALAGGGNVLPGAAKPKGYSLSDMAAATAVFNSGFTNGSPSTPPPPPVPFEILVADATLRTGTMIYLPIFYWDDSGGAPPGFPANISNQQADAAFLNSQAINLYGIEAFIVQVDGQTTVLDNSYICGVTTPPLLDGTPPGTHYIISAAFLTPLTPGRHVVSLGGIVNGAPVAFLTYQVTVH